MSTEMTMHNSRSVTCDHRNGVIASRLGSVNASTEVLLVCGVTILLWSLPLSGAQPNAGKPAVTRPAAATAKPNNAKPSPSKPTATSPSANGSPAADVVRRPAVEPVPEADSDSLLGDSLRLRLWRSRILPPDPNEDAGTREALQGLIQKVATMTLESHESKPASRPVVAIEKPSAGPQRAKSQQPPATEQPEATGPGLPEPVASLPAATLERLTHLMQDPNQVRDPLKMAELLFLSDRPVEAAVFYEKALALTAPNDPTTADDRAWILFQLGTSLRSADAAKAKDMYLKLISEFPNSPWTELAKANGRLISWFQDAKPQQVISAPAP